MLFCTNVCRYLIWNVLIPYSCGGRANHWLEQLLHDPKNCQSFPGINCGLYQLWVQGGAGNEHVRRRPCQRHASRFQGDCIFLGCLWNVWRTRFFSLELSRHRGFDDDGEARPPRVSASRFWWTHSRINSARGELETVHLCFPPSLSETHSSKWTHRPVGRTTWPQHRELRKLTKNSNNNNNRHVSAHYYYERAETGRNAGVKPWARLAGGIVTGGNERVPPQTKVLRSPWAQHRFTAVTRALFASQ